MKMSLKKVLAAFLALLTVTSVVACGGKAEPADKTSGTSAKSSVTGKTIRVVAANHDYGEVIKSIINEFEEKTGIKVKYEGYADDPLTQKLTVELTSGNSSIDVFMTRPLQDGLLFNKNGWYTKLDDYINNADKTSSEWDYSDFVTLDWSKGSIKDINFIPVTNEFEILYYNKKLLADAGVQPPKTFEELEKAAAKLTDKTKGIYGIVSRGNMGAATSPFSGYLFGFGGDYLSDGRCSLDTEGSVKAFEYYGKLLANYGPPGAINMAWPQCVPIFLDGKAAMFTDAAGLLPQMTKMGENLGLAIMPGGKPWIAPTWGLSIAGSSSKKDEAWQFIQWATSKEIMKKCALKSVTQTRKSVMNDPEVISTQHPGFAEVAGDASKNGIPYDKPVMLQVGKARDFLGEVIVKSIESGGKADIKGLAKDATDKINNLLKESGELKP